MSLNRILLGALIASLLLASAAAVSLFLSPATLAAVAAYSVYGLTVAGLVGANALVQIGAIAALTAGASFVAALSFAGITNAFSAVANYFSKKSTTPATGVVVEPGAAAFGADAPASSTAAMTGHFSKHPAPANDSGAEDDLDDDLDDENDAEKAKTPLIPVPAKQAVEEEQNESAPSMNGQ
jgi:hypothetical protein